MAFVPWLLESPDIFPAPSLKGWMPLERQAGGAHDGGDATANEYRMARASGASDARCAGGKNAGLGHAKNFDGNRPCRLGRHFWRLCAREPASEMALDRLSSPPRKLVRRLA